MSADKIAPVEGPHEIYQHFPTPLAWLFQQAFHNYGERRSWMTYLFGETLRFLALLAFQDSLAHDLFGADTGAPKQTLEKLRQPVTFGNWRNLLHESCSYKVAESGSRFIPEFVGWEKDSLNASLLDHLLKGRNELVHGFPPPHFRYDDKAEEYEEKLRRFYGSISFLKHYLLILVLKGPDRFSSGVLVQILRGATPNLESVDLEIEAGSSLQVEADELYLLNPHGRLALRLFPVLLWAKFDSGTEVCGFHQFIADDGQTKRATIDSFTSTRKMELVDQTWLRRLEEVGTKREPSDVQLSVKLPLTGLIGRWLGPKLLKDAFHIDWDGVSTAVANVGKFLSEESWKRIETLVKEPDEVEIVGGRYRVERLLRAGEHVDIFQAVEEGKEDAGRLATHVLKKGVSDNGEVRGWFKQRLACWKKIKQANVLLPLPSSDPESKQPRPFLVTDLIRQGRSLQELLRSEGALPPAQLAATLRIAAEVCRAAHQRNIRLVTLPPRHFLLDQFGKLWVTGFDTAVEVNEQSAAPSKEYWQRFSRDWNYIAPEALQGLASLDERADVFALGVLLEWLQGKAGLARQSLEEQQRTDAWACLAYHCLAVDPNLRFQTASQFLKFLDEWVLGSPEMVEVPEGRVLGQDDGELVPRFRIGRYPVTNFEYELFCRETRHEFSLAYRQENPRLTGPWCPVVGVSLIDAQKYCEWLGKKTGRRWRLPRESEWMRAAVLDQPRQYPWDDIEPVGGGKHHRDQSHPKRLKKAQNTRPVDRTKHTQEPVQSRANYDRLYRGPTVVGAFEDGYSAAGCYDMAGNVWEWCTDFISPDDPRRVLKGGAYDFSFGDLQVQARYGAVVACLSPHIGFRVICEE